MRIAAVGTFWSPSKPYAGNFAIAGFKKLQNYAEIKLINLRAVKPGRKIVEEAEIGGIPVIHLSVPLVPGNPLISLALTKMFIPLIRPLIADCDLVHSVGCFIQTGILFSYICRSAGKHHLVQLVGSDVNDTLIKYHAHRFLNGWDCNIHAVAGVSNDILGKFHTLYPEVPNIQTVYRGVDTKRFSGIERGVPSEINFLFLGGFPSFDRNFKGGELIQNIWKSDEVFFTEQNAFLTLAGIESDDAANKQWLASLKHPERVKLMGNVDPDDIPNLIGGSDILLAPSTMEGLPNTVMEAAAGGLPAITTNAGGIPEIVINNETGILLDNRDISTWQQIMKECCVNTDKYRTMGKAARTHMELHFNADNYPLGIYNLYQIAMKEPLNR